MKKQDALDAALAQIGQAFGKDVAPCPRPESLTELVAREMCRAHYRHEGLSWQQAQIAEDAGWRHWLQDARSLFCALVTPTEEMLDDAEGWQAKDAYQDLETERERIDFLWGVMLDCAEAEYDDEGNSRAEKRAAELARWNALSQEEREEQWAAWEAEHWPNGAPF